jgi:putative addiction module component (TIGR02574 family)
MTANLKEVEKQALRLSPRDREILAEIILRSLEGESITEIDEAWVAEAEKRYQSYKNGKVEGIPGKHLFSDIRQELGWKS